MRNKFMVALVAATALVPAVAIAQDGRRGEGRQQQRIERQANRAEADRTPAAREQRQAIRAERQAQRQQALPEAVRQAAPVATQQAREQRRIVRQANPQAQVQRQQQRLDRQTFRVDQPEVAVTTSGVRRGQDFPGERRGLRQDFRTERRDDRQDFRQERQQDRNALNNGVVTQREFRRDRNDDRQDFRRDRGDDRRGFRQNQRRFGGDRNWSDGRGWNGNDRGWNGNGNRFGADRDWDRGWRQDRRYDWRGFRQQNRNLYRLPRYYAPRGYGYGYQRFDIGLTLSSILFAQNYWINDPWAYRLPPIDGPFRWVRYYNDALLVDLDSGEVVDIEYDIFW